MTLEHLLALGKKEKLASHVYTLYNYGKLVMVSTIRKWGNSLGLLVPKQLAEALNIKEGTEIELLETEQGLLLRPRTQHNVSMQAILDGIPEDYNPQEDAFEDLLDSEQW